MKQPLTPQWHLGPQDITADSIINTSIMYIRIKASKTDPFRLGVTIAVGKTTDQVCAIKAMLPNLVIRGPCETSLFWFTSGSFLSLQRFVDEVRRVLSAAGINAALYSGHSFCIGAFCPYIISVCSFHTRFNACNNIIIPGHNLPEWLWGGR